MQLFLCFVLFIPIIHLKFILSCLSSLALVAIIVWFGVLVP